MRSRRNIAWWRSKIHSPARCPRAAVPGIGFELVDRAVVGELQEDDVVVVPAVGDVVPAQELDPELLLVLPHLAREDRPHEELEERVAATADVEEGREDRHRLNPSWRRWCRDPGGGPGRRLLSHAGVGLLAGCFVGRHVSVRRPRRAPRRRRPAARRGGLGASSAAGSATSAGVGGRLPPRRRSAGSAGRASSAGSSAAGRSAGSCARPSTAAASSAGSCAPFGRRSARHLGRRCRGADGGRISAGVVGRGPLGRHGRARRRPRAPPGARPRAPRPSSSELASGRRRPWARRSAATRRSRKITDCPVSSSRPMTTKRRNARSSNGQFRLRPIGISTMKKPRTIIWNQKQPRPGPRSGSSSAPLYSGR